MPSYHNPSPATGNHPHHGFYRKINKPITDKVQTRILILQSSLATLTHLFDHTDDPDKSLAYINSIGHIRQELAKLRECQ